MNSVEQNATSIETPKKEQVGKQEQKQSIPRKMSDEKDNPL